MPPTYVIGWAIVRFRTACQWRMANAECRMSANAECLRMGEWRMANGEWRMANGEWGMGNGEWLSGALAAFVVALGVHLDGREDVDELLRLVEKGIDGTLEA